MTVGGWIGLLLGLVFGCIAGFVAGAMVVDNYWKKRIETIENDIRNASKAPYEIKPKDKKYFL